MSKPSRRPGREAIKEQRKARKLRHKLTVLLIYGILCFAFQMSSRRKANQEMTRPVFEENLRQLFPDLEELPHQDTLARLLARMDVNEIQAAHLDMIRQLIRGKKFGRYLIGNCYPVAVDGSQSDKQDCEQRAFGRLAQRLKQAFSHLPILLLLDGLYANGPIMELCRKNNWDFMTVLQDESLPSVWEEIHGLKKFQSANRWSQPWGNRRQRFWWVNQIEYHYAHPLTQRQKSLKVHAVICEESWEEIAPGGTEVVKKTSRHAWLSDQPLHRNNVHSRCNLGARRRWGIETGFLVEKHHGYLYEHCFS